MPVHRHAAIPQAVAGADPRRPGRLPPTPGSGPTMPRSSSSATRRSPSSCRCSRRASATGSRRPAPRGTKAFTRRHPGRAAADHADRPAAIAAVADPRRRGDCRVTGTRRSRSPLSAANDVLGGSFLSRLNMDLRETKRLGLWRRRPAQPASSTRCPIIVFAPVQADRTGDFDRRARATMLQPSSAAERRHRRRSSSGRSTAASASCPAASRPRRRVLGALQHERPLSPARTIITRRSPSRYRR